MHFLKCILENVMNDLPYVTLQKTQNCWIAFFKLLILEAYGEITQYKLYTSSPHQNNEVAH